LPEAEKDETAVKPFRVVLLSVAFFPIAVLTLAAAASGGGTAGSQAGAVPGLALAKSHGKLSSRLAILSKAPYSTAPASVQARAVSLPASGAGSLLRTKSGKRLIVYVRTSGPAAAVAEAIEATGATVVNVSRRYRVITIAATTAQLAPLAKLPEVTSAFEALAPVLSACNPVVSEGDTALNAATARSTFGVDGSGVTVGILSDSYNHLGGAATGVAGGELPGPGNPCGYTTPVNVLQDDTLHGSDEGRAMMEIVHDLAPGASLSFATADFGIFAAADNIRALRDAGADVIADDVTFVGEPMFQEGPIGTAIDDVTSSGVSYFSSAGNSNISVSAQEDGSYEAPSYRPTTCPTSVSAFGEGDCHDFYPPASAADNGADYTLAPGGYLVVDLQWAEPWNGVTTDLDLFLIDGTTGTVLDSSVNRNVTNTQEPVEAIGNYVNNTGAPKNVEVVIGRYSGTATPRLKYVLLRSSGVTSVEYPTSSGGDIVGPTIFGHNGDRNAITTAAVDVRYLSMPDYYTSPGPVTYYFGPADGTNTAALLSSPEVLSKPDLAAVDCVQTSFFPASGYYFCGTSAAAPHAAAVAALMLARYPSLTPAQVLARLNATARAVPSGGTADLVGAGLIDAGLAVGPTFSFSASTYSVAESGSSAAITITRPFSVSDSTSVHFSASGGSATAGSDFTAVSETVTFAAGETQKTVYVPIANDTAIEANETVSLALSDPSTGSALASPSAATLTIVDDDRAIAFDSSSFQVQEGEGSAEIAIVRTGLTSGTDSVSFATSNGTAKAGSDYTSVSKTVTFPAGESWETVSVPIKNDKIHEQKETVNLTLSSPSSEATLGSVRTAVLTITDNDKAPVKANGKIKSAKLTMKSFTAALAKKAKLTVTFSPKSKLFKWAIKLKRGKKWVAVKAATKHGSFAKKTMTVKQLFSGKKMLKGSYKLKLSADKNSKALSFKIK
jgi:subtilisin family serine protease